MKRKLKISGFILLIVFISSCNDFLDVNTDPNNPSSSTVELTLPTGIASAAFVLGDQFQILGSLWAQHWTQAPAANQYAAIDDYDINENSYTGAYSELYSGALVDLKFVSDNANANEDWNYFLISEVMSAYVFQMLVDMYDKVPYSEALKGNLGEVTPKFDNGEDIYDDLIARIDNALSKDRSLASARPVGEADMIFDGDMDQWVKFANTLKLKIFMRQSAARPSVAQAGIEGLFNSGAEFLDSEDAQMDAFEDVQDYRNPFFAAQISTAGNGRGYVDIVASNTILDELNAAGDPRISELFDTPVNGGSNYIGLQQGDYNTTVYASARDLSQPDIGPTHPIVFMSVAESKFLQAEAVERFGVTGDAQALYEEGIEASFDKLGVSGASTLYGPGGAYEFDPANAIEQIITQKWIAMVNFQGLEAHVERKRTGFPDFFETPPGNVTSGLYPQRLPYPSAEIDNNRDELNAVGGQKQVTERVWWNTL